MEMKSGSDVKTMGSGFIVSVAGYVVTNYSIVDAAGGVKNLEMKLPTGETVKVKQVISTDQELDLAVLAFEPAKNMSAVGLGHVDVRAGEKVKIVNSPAEIKGLKTLPDGRQLIEMTAPIPVTSSGGPVFNSAGQIVCVVVAKVRNAEGQRYCVPIRDVIPNLEGVPDVQIATTK